MGTKSTKNTLLILTILLCLVVVGLGAYTLKVHGEMQENESRLKEEKAIIAQELKEEIKKYTDVLTEKNMLSNQLSDAKENLEALQKRLDSNEITQSTVRAYRIELNKMRRERELLFKQNDSLLNETERLAKLNEDNQDVVRICYEVNENKLAKAGDLDFFVQVLKSDGKMIGIPREEKLSNGKNIRFNSRTTIPYSNKPFNVCELVLPVQTLIKMYTLSRNRTCEIHDHRKSEAIKRLKKQNNNIATS